jgi:hypothetical protein
MNQINQIKKIILKKNLKIIQNKLVLTFKTHVGHKPKTNLKKTNPKK